MRLKITHSCHGLQELHVLMFIILILQEARANDPVLNGHIFTCSFDIYTEWFQTFFSRLKMYLQYNDRKGAKRVDHNLFISNQL